MADTVMSQWAMMYGHDSIYYQYRLHISGRTLVVRVESLRGSTEATGLTFDRCENASNPIIVKVPYLTLFNLVACNQSCTSLFFDWETTNSSTYTPPDPAAEIVSPSSVRFAPTVRYFMKTNGVRNELRETIYLTVSPDLDGALPNLSGPVAPTKNILANRTILSYGQPFPWLLHPGPGKAKYLYLDSISHRGVKNLAVIIKNWQEQGYDHAYPCVWPPNPFIVDACWGWRMGGNGGSSGLKSVRNHIVNTLGYDCALHENYFDYFTTADSGTWRYDDKKVARTPNNVLLRGFINCSHDTARVLKPALAPGCAAEVSKQINEAAPTWTYLDVHSAFDPSYPIDYDTGTDNPGRDSAGLFLYTLHQYRRLPGILRQNHGGPVQGEGGNQFLYAGYFDDFDGTIHHLNDAKINGSRAPLLVDFDLWKIHPKSTQHGVGHIEPFLMLRPTDVARLTDTAKTMVMKYIATELAYGHGGLVTKGNDVDHTIYQATLEYTYVLPMQRAYMNAMPQSIRYGDGLQSAVEYISVHPRYADNANPDFMGKVRVEYDNGVVVCVNRSDSPWKLPAIENSSVWFDFHVLVNGKDSLGVGPMPQGDIVLMPQTGWFCALPFNPVN
jgi:hypothetical protein